MIGLSAAVRIRDHDTSARGPQRPLEQRRRRAGRRIRRSTSSSDLRRRLPGRVVPGPNAYRGRSRQPRSWSYRSSFRLEKTECRFRRTVPRGSGSCARPRSWAAARPTPSARSVRSFDISADVLSDGHEALVAIVRWKPAATNRWSETPMHRVDADADGIRWGGCFSVDQLGPWHWQVESWADRLATWREEIRRKVAFGQTDLAGELSEGAALLAQTAAERRAGIGRSSKPRWPSSRTPRWSRRPGPRPRSTRTWPQCVTATLTARRRCAAPRLTIDVDPVLARFGSWYELFPARGVA